MHAETLAPHRLVSSQTISLQDASTILERYMTASEVHSHLHPDALITPSGTVFGADGGPAGGVVMHNLRRVAAGLKGNYLEPEPTPDPESEKMNEPNGADEAPSQLNGKTTDGVAAEDWQEMSEFEREEGAIEVGEVGERSNFVQQGEVESGGKKRKDDDAGKLDKAARKKAKKAKDKEFRAQKEKARAEQSA